MKLREFLERFFPSEPFKISFSRFKLLLLIIIICFISGILYLRSQNKSELEFLRHKHQEIQLAVKNYLNNMSQIDYHDVKGQEIVVKMDKYKKQLYSIEEKINNIKNFWFLE